MSDVMARLLWTRDTIARGTRVRWRRRRRLELRVKTALDVSLVLVPEALELLLLGVKDETKPLPHGTDLQLDSHRVPWVRHFVRHSIGLGLRAGLWPCSRQRFREGAAGLYPNGETRVSGPW